MKKTALEIFKKHGAHYYENDEQLIIDAMEEYASQSTPAKVDEVKWISVEDRLPEDRILHCLVFNGKDAEYMQCVFIATWFKESNSFTNYSEKLVGLNRITHWQPLPPLPTTNP